MVTFKSSLPLALEYMLDIYPEKIDPGGKPPAGLLFLSGISVKEILIRGYLRLTNILKI